MQIPLAIVFLGLLVFLAHALEELFARTRIPDVLLLLCLGLLLGPVGHWVHPSDFGAVGPVFTTITLVVILFEGGLGLDLGVVRRSLGGATALAVWSFLGTLAVVSPLAHLFLDLTWLQAATLGAILGGTSSAVVIPVVQRLRLGADAKALLAIESALSDVLVLVVALALMQAQARGTLQMGVLIRGMIESFLGAAILGGGAALAWSLALTRLKAVRDSLFTTPAFVFVVYGLVELLGLSGAIAALVMGIVLGNLDDLPLRSLKMSPEAVTSLSATERRVFGEGVFLLKTVLFVYVGLSIQLSDFRLVLAGLALTGAVFLLRVPVVHASLSPVACSRFEAAVSGAMTPKGLAAAVVASLPVQMGLPKGQEVKLTTFAVVLFSILLTSLLVFALERGWGSGIARVLYGRYPDPSQAPES